jgi:hypothetical protein
VFNRQEENWVVKMDPVSGEDTTGLALAFRTAAACPCRDSP